jgi:magnesium transporter
MARFVKGSRTALGQAPGTLVHVGEIHEARTLIARMTYDESTFTEESCDEVAELPPAGSPGVTWLNVDGVHDSAVIERVGELGHIHPLVLEDVMQTDQRPKLEEYSESLFVSLRMLRFVEERREIDDEQVSLVLGSSWLISFQEKPGDVFDPVRERIRTARGRVRRAGADYLFYSLIDAIVDHYFVVLEHIGDWVEEVYERVTLDPSRSDLNDIRLLKRELLFMRRSIWPLREVLSRLQHEDSPLLSQETIPYLRDVYDHTIQIIDTIETFRDMLGSVTDVYLSSLSNRMNEVMKVLTIIATIFIPLSFIAGIYGMNFTWMPELHWHYGYLFALGLMATVAGGMLYYFRRKRWL